MASSFQRRSHDTTDYSGLSSENRPETMIFCIASAAGPN
jgi:hypothetical protein